MLKNTQILVITNHLLLWDAISVSLTRSKIHNPKPRHAKTIDDAITHLKTQQFQLIMLDLSGSTDMHFRSLVKLKAQYAEHTPVIVMSSVISPECCHQAKQLGASGLLDKNCSFDTIRMTINRVFQGQTVFLEAEDNCLEPQLANLASLTPAQKRVITGLSDGLLNKQIAHEMGITEATAKAHMTAIFRKLGASNRTQAMLIYRDSTSASID